MVLGVDRSFCKNCLKKCPERRSFGGCDSWTKSVLVLSGLRSSSSQGLRQSQSGSEFIRVEPASDECGPGLSSKGLLPENWHKIIIIIIISVITSFKGHSFLFIISKESNLLFPQVAIAASPAPPHLLSFSLGRLIRINRLSTPEMVYIL